MNGSGKAPFAPRRLRAVLAAASVLVGAAAGETRAQDSASDATRLNPLNALRPSDFKSFRERPLFNPSRRPPPVVPDRPERAPVEPERAPVEAESGGDEPPNVRLTGVVHGLTAAMAILQRPDVGARSTVRVGDGVDGWIVTAIDSLSIRLRSGAREREYRLFARDSLPISGPSHAAAPDPGARDTVR